LKGIKGRAIEYPIHTATASNNPWTSGSTFVTTFEPGRVVKILTDREEIVAIIFLFRTGEVRTCMLTDLHVIPEINNDKGHYVISSRQRFYIKDDFLHREDGPAIEGIKESKDNKYFLYGVEYSPEDWLDTLPKEQQTEMLFHLDEIRKE
jgi:hypothetical protein